MKRWTKDEEELLRKLIEKGLKHTEIVDVLGRSIKSIANKAHRLNLFSICTKHKTHKEYIENLPKEIICKEMYIDAHTKILHEHTICGHIWKVQPRSIVLGHSCPNCCSGYSDGKIGYLYLVKFIINFEEVYKVGITNNPKSRFKTFGYKPEVILLRKFDKGKKARELETIWLKVLEPYKYNTGLLRSGNTETFKY